MLQRFSLVAVALAALSFSSQARADVPPSCTDFDKAPSCTKENVGKPCPEGPDCREINCGDSTAMTIYKCMPCPTVVDDPGKVCDPDGTGGPPQWGKACGDGGSCIKWPGFCPAPGGNVYSICAKTPPPPGGTGGAGGMGAGGAPPGMGGAPPGMGGAPPGMGGAPAAGGSGTAGQQATAGAAGSGTAGSAAAPAPASSSGDDGGCSVSALGRHGALAALMTLLGAAALLVERRRR